MGLDYRKLWHLMLDKKVNKSRLREWGIHSTTITKLTKNEAVSTETIERICKLLSCQPADIMEYIPDKKETETN